MKLVIDGVDVSRHGDLRDVAPGSEDLSQPIVVLSTVLQDRATSAIPKVPAYGLEAQLYDDDGTTLRWGGYISRVDVAPRGVRRAWRIQCQSWSVRAFEGATGSLNKSGVTDSDRNFVIAAFRDALKAQSFGLSTGLDDAIVTANELENWRLVKATAFLSGSDWSYMHLSDVMAALLQLVPGVRWRIRADKLVEYGRATELAPFVLTSRHELIDGATYVGYEGYSESEIVAGHVNKIRRGGAAAAEETATDEVSHVRFRRILDSPYTNDEGVPATDLRRRTYAELQAARVRRTAAAAITDVQPRAGQAVDVVNTTLGNIGGDKAPFVDTLRPIFARSATGRLARGYRGRMVIQRVERLPLGNRHHRYALALGDPARDFATALAVKVV